MKAFICFMYELNPLLKLAVLCSYAWLCGFIFHIFPWDYSQIYWWCFPEAITMFVVFMVLGQAMFERRS